MEKRSTCDYKRNLLGFERGETDNRRAIYQAFLNDVPNDVFKGDRIDRGARATRQLPEITHRSLCPVERRHPTKARKRFGSRERRASHSCDLIHYTRVCTRAQGRGRKREERTERERTTGRKGEKEEERRKEVPAHLLAR